MTTPRIEGLLPPSGYAVVIAIPACIRAVSNEIRPFQEGRIKRPHPECVLNGGNAASWSVKASRVSATTRPATDTTMRAGWPWMEIGWSGPGSLTMLFFSFALLFCSCSDHR